METTLLTVSKIFSERIFRIPDYQRGYAWLEKQLKDYWNDMDQLDKGKNHYVGVLTLEPVSAEEYKKWRDDLWIIQSKNYEPFYIVDGQQRLTTTIILIQAIIEFLGSGKELNYTSIDDIKRKFIFETKGKGISRSYIFGYEKDNPSYEYLKSKIFNETPEENFIHQETVYTHNLEFAKTFFLDKLKDLSISEIEDLYNKITQHFLFNIYIISDEIDVFVTFETMNNRGKLLSLLELLKNRLIYLTTKFNEEPLEKERLRKKINDCWKTIYHNLGKNKENPLDDDKFLYNHLMFYFGKELINVDEKTGVKSLYNRLSFRRWRFSDYLLEKKFSIKRIHFLNKSLPKEKLTIDEINAYVESLQVYVEIWYTINNPLKSSLSEEEKRWLYKLDRLGFDEFAPLILVFYRKVNDSQNRIKLLQSIERILFLLTMVYRHSVDFSSESYYFKAINLFDNSITYQQVLAELEEDAESLFNNPENLEKIKKEFRKDGFYHWDGIRYFLYEYEESLRLASKSTRTKINWDEYNVFSDDFVTVEHIYPQTTRKGPWYDNFCLMSGKQRSILKNSLGNLLPLSHPKNSSLQNKPFIDKLGDDVNHVGYRYGSYSENEITTYDDWTPEYILERGLKLLSFMERNWKMDFLGEENKVEILGLEFLKKT